MTWAYLFQRKLSLIKRLFSNSTCETGFRTTKEKPARHLMGTPASNWALQTGRVLFECLLRLFNYWPLLKTFQSCLCGLCISSPRRQLLKHQQWSGNEIITVLRVVIFQGNYFADKLQHLTDSDGSCNVCLLSMSRFIYIKDNKIQGDITAKWILQAVNAMDVQRERIQTLHALKEGKASCQEWRI